MTIITRSALVSWGHNPPPELASVVIPHAGAEREIVTWSDVMRRRREEQDGILKFKRGRQEPEMRAFRVYVACFDQFLMGGWQAFVDGIHYHAWIDRDRRWLKPVLMEAFPLTLNLGDAWENWKIEFARRFESRRQDRKPVGVAYVWWDEDRDLRVAKTRKAASC